MTIKPFKKTSLADCPNIAEYGLSKELVPLEPSMLPACPSSSPLLRSHHHIRLQRSELYIPESSRENQPPSITNANEESKLSGAA